MGINKKIGSGWKIDIGNIDHTEHKEIDEITELRKRIFWSALIGVLTGFIFLGILLILFATIILV